MILSGLTGENSFSSSVKNFLAQCSERALSIFFHGRTGWKSVEKADVQWLGNMHAVWRKAEDDDIMFSCCFDGIGFVV